MTDPKREQRGTQRHQLTAQSRLDSWCLVVLTLLTLPWVCVRADEPLGKLTSDEQDEVKRLMKVLDQHVTAARFEEAVTSYKKIVAYRESKQGKDHWEVKDARREVEKWQRLCTVPQKERPRVVQALQLVVRGQQSQQRIQYREAEAHFREALAIVQKVLVEAHPETASCSSELATCLHRQGKFKEAVSLFGKALDISKKAWGEGHPRTATYTNNLASCLRSQGQLNEALSLYRSALKICQRSLGEEHPNTSTSYSNVAMCLDDLGQPAEALSLHQKALSISRKVVGETHLGTAINYDNLASCLHRQKKYREALPLFQKGLGITRKVLGDNHPETSFSCNNVGVCLVSLKQHAEALPLFRMALNIRTKVLRDNHPDTITSYFNLAACLQQLGKYGEAVPLFQKVSNNWTVTLGEAHPKSILCYHRLASCLGEQGKHGSAYVLHQKLLTLTTNRKGENHLDTARCYNNLALCMTSLGMHDRSLPLFQKALDICRDQLGAEHLQTAVCYQNVAHVLHTKQRYTEALPLFQKVLQIRKKGHGEEHPRTIMSYYNLASCLEKLEKYAEAVSLYQRALTISQKVLGESHPDTASSHDSLAYCLVRDGNLTKAAEHWESAVVGHEYGRYHVSSIGFERSFFRATSTSPRAALACLFAKQDQPVKAWEHAEADLSRGLLDALPAPDNGPSEYDKLARLRVLDQSLLALYSMEKPTPEQLWHRETIHEERKSLLQELDRSAVQAVRNRVLNLEDIQPQIPPKSALVFWLDVDDLGHFGCVLRNRGKPHWVELPAQDPNKGWSLEDKTLIPRTLTALVDRQSNPEERTKLLTASSQQRLSPLTPFLKGVEHLLVVASGTMSMFPVETWTDEYSISYVPSASIYARRAEEHRPLQGSSLLVVADPVFERKKPGAEKLPPAPKYGLLISATLPNSLAARIGLRAGDVLMEYNGKQLSKPEDLTSAKDQDRIPLKLWREGKVLSGRIPPGKLGVVVDKRPLAEALTEWRKNTATELVREDQWSALPGTRLEARALAELMPLATVLLGSDASEKKLQALATTDQLKKFRLLHFATHGQINSLQPKLSALILSQDDLPSSEEQAVLVSAGNQPQRGKLTLGTILNDWNLDADLVVLSACESGLGKKTNREGMLGFSQALLQKGARSVVLSRWKVDDAATALLMARFYQNLLGKRDGLDKPMPRAEALSEAKVWLRKLTRAEAETRLAELVDGVPHGERGRIGAKLPVRERDEPQQIERLFAHPYYWAAFVLIGDPK